ncbi:HDOD domain-containing protein [Catenovulum maritimum]|jgi:HD-like signal output (HDOD) protein|uniref:Histidine kinase n=1 Tax=Catenovulum maritimum TaxID=1513271 RepID=A0A0J8GS29_9ALTE|nr:HDOD domain-containing protein [Catenovulum maritimum]KMT64109.1 histidine kinase [Catenovulum maritimum]
MSTENALLTILAEKIKNDSLVLPTLPEAAIRVRKAADDPDINLNQMAEVIAQDPALSARMLKIANSAYMGRAIKVETINQAVTRIGLRQIKNIATALAMEQLFVSKNPVVKLFLSKVWGITIDVSACAMATLKAYITRNKHTSLNFDTITLAAMVHNIGVLPILTEAERHEEVFANPEFLEGAISKLAGRVGGSIMRAWDFSPEFVTVAERWNDKRYIPENVCYIDFVRIAAVHAGVMPIEGSKEDFYAEYVEKGVLTDVNFLESDDFTEQFNAAKSIFAD